MPTIYKPKTTRYKKYNESSSKRILQSQLYNSPTWKALRLKKLHADPLCEMCLEENRVTPA
jgi:5-methylcytosine-specific restriction protein A